jgi:hypothetical protein
VLLLVLKKEEGAAKGEKTGRGQEKGCEKEGRQEGARLGGEILEGEQQALVESHRMLIEFLVVQ